MGFGSGLGAGQRRRCQLLGQAAQSIGQVLFRARQHVDRGIVCIGPRGFARVGEKIRGCRGADQDDIGDAVEPGAGGVCEVGYPLDLEAPAPAGYARVLHRTEELRTCRRRDALGIGHGILCQGTTGHQQQAGPATAQGAGDIQQHIGGNAWRGYRRHGCCDLAACIPADIRGQDQAGDAARCGTGSLDRRRSGGSDRSNLCSGARPDRDGTCPTFDVGGQWRVVLAVMGGVVANDVDDRRVRSSRVVQIGQAVCQAGAAVQQRGRRLAGNARIAIRRAGNDAFEQAQHAAHAGDAVERGNKMHFAGPGIGEARVHSTFQQRAYQAFGTIDWRTTVAHVYSSWTCCCRRGRS
ncbi:hypothetical protein D3C76_789020 [compost metagenome]